MSVVLLGCADRTMAQEQGDRSNVRALRQQEAGKRVAEPVRIGINSREFGNAVHRPSQVLNACGDISIARPKHECARLGQLVDGYCRSGVQQQFDGSFVLHLANGEVSINNAAPLQGGDIRDAQSCVEERQQQSSGATARHPSKVGVIVSELRASSQQGRDFRGGIWHGPITGFLGRFHSLGWVTGKPVSIHTERTERSKRLQFLSGRRSADLARRVAHDPAARTECRDVSYSEALYPSSPTEALKSPSVRR